MDPLPGPVPGIGPARIAGRAHHGDSAARCASGRCVIASKELRRGAGAVADDEFGLEESA